MSSNRLSPAKPCRYFVRLLPLASDNVLAPDVSARLDEHLAICASCRSVRASYEAAYAALARDFAARQRVAPHCRFGRAEAWGMARDSEQRAGQLDLMTFKQFAKQCGEDLL